MKHSIKFIVSIFGSKHVGMLIANVYSILKSNPGCAITVFWQDIEERLINNIIKGFREVTFIKTNFDLISDPIKRISSKTIFWNYAAQTYPNDNICFLDVDTLVIKNISDFFDKDFDIIFTYKDDQFPLNTGVMLCKGDKYPLFFKKWLEETDKITNDPELFEKANSPEYPYGAPDQMSFFEMLRYNPNQREYILTINGQKLVFKGIPCEVLNEVNSRKITGPTHIIHYKGGWQLILLEGRDFTVYRTKSASWQMYMLYLKTFLKSLEFLNKHTNIRLHPKDFNIVIPFYINKHTFQERIWAYPLYSYLDRLKQRFRD